MVKASTVSSNIFNRIYNKQYESQHQQWEMVIEASKHDPFLEELLNKALVYWKLKYDQPNETTNDAETGSSI